MCRTLGFKRFCNPLAARNESVQQAEPAILTAPCKQRTIPVRICAAETAQAHILRIRKSHSHVRQIKAPDSVSADHPDQISAQILDALTREREEKA